METKPSHHLPPFPLANPNLPGKWVDLVPEQVPSGDVVAIVTEVVIVR